MSATTTQTMTSKGDVPPGIKNPARRVLENPVTGEVGTILKYSYETGGEYSLAEVVCEPNGGPPLHFHRSYAEHFESMEGELVLQIGDNEPKTVTPGGWHEIPAGTLHRFSAGPKGCKARVKIVPASPGFEKAMYVLFGLSNDGLCGPDGLPKSMLHTAVVGSLGDIYFPGAGGAFINLLTSAMAAYARWSGVQDALLKKYWES